MFLQPLLSRLQPWARSSVFLIRLFLLLVVLRWLAPAPPQLELGPRQTVETLHSKICVHTRLDLEVEEWKIQRTLSLVREMGASTIVEFFPWPYVEHQPGQYDWTNFDRIMRHAHNQGLSVIARMGLVPDWARPPVHEKVTTLQYLPYDRFDDFAAFVGAFVARYREDVSAVIIWNEPNVNREWGDREVDPAAYTELLRVSYQAAHAANPNIIVLGGALAPTLADDEASTSLNDLQYLELMYEAGAADYFDALAVHTYGMTYPPDAEPQPGTVNFRRVELVRDIMIRYGDADKPVYITESGWNDHPYWVNAVRPSQRLAYTLEAFDRVEQWPWAEALCLWIFRQPLDSHNPRDAYYALVSSDFYLKPIYEALQAYARGWENPYEMP